MKVGLQVLCALMKLGRLLHAANVQTDWHFLQKLIVAHLLLEIEELDEDEHLASVPSSEAIEETDDTGNYFVDSTAAGCFQTGLATDSTLVGNIHD